MFYFSKKVRLFSQNGVLFLFYFLINPTMTTVKAGDQDLGRPWRVQWCETSSSLVVAEDSDFNWIVSVIKLEF